MSPPPTQLATDSAKSMVPEMELFQIETEDGSHAITALVSKGLPSDESFQAGLQHAQKMQESDAAFAATQVDPEKFTAGFELMKSFFLTAINSTPGLQSESSPGSVTDEEAPMRGQD